VDTDVLVVGAGPTGLMLAQELARAGAGVLVVDRLAERSGQSKALNVQPRTAEVLDQRGLLPEVTARGLGRLSGGHFAGLPLDYAALDSRHHYQVGIPQARLEAVLAEHLAAAGVEVRRPGAVTALTQDADGVTATLDDGSALRARFLVGCDGGRSTVRKLAGIAFPGQDARMIMVVADVLVDAGTSASMATDPEGTHQRFLRQLAPADGQFRTVLPLADGVLRLMFAGEAQQRLDRDAPVTRAEIEDAFGTAEFTVREVRWASRFTDAARQAEQYRAGRVLLAGDAAHIHLPTGGQGLNLGVQDAFNLGWKLAAEVRGWAPPGLLDTYHAERHPVGQAVLDNTRIQGVLLAPLEEAVLVRGLVARLAALPEANRLLASMISGLAIRYDLPGPEHPLLGARLPDLDLADGGQVAALFHPGRGVLLELTPGTPHPAVVKPWADRVDAHTVTLAAGPGSLAGVDAVLVRPDGHIAWLGPDPATLVPALRTWFGTPSSTGAQR
jgi:2-polyprenyl-6-methoxyphenol hydroxylase-like FAD-dependent oxidoreductase